MAKRLGFTSRCAIGFIAWYQRLTRHLPHRCRFYPSCSSYAKQAIIQQGLGYGLILTIWRLCRCIPGLPCDIDPPPEKRSKV